MIILLVVAVVVVVVKEILIIPPTGSPSTLPDVYSILNAFTPFVLLTTPLSSLSILHPLVESNRVAEDSNQGLSELKKQVLHPILPLR